METDEQRMRFSLKDFRFISNAAYENSGLPDGVHNARAVRFLSLIFLFLMKKQENWRMAEK